MISRSNCALCGASHNAHYAECAIMRSESTRVAVWRVLQRRDAPHNTSSRNEVISLLNVLTASLSWRKVASERRLLDLLVSLGRTNECGGRGDTMTDHFYSFK